MKRKKTPSKNAQMQVQLNLGSNISQVFSSFVESALREKMRFSVQRNGGEVIEQLGHKGWAVELIAESVGKKI